MDERIRRSERIRSRKDFSGLYKNGGRVRAGFFHLVFRLNSLGYGRFAVVAGKKVGTAVVRNRIKRLARDVYRRHKGLLPPGLDLIIVARPEAAGAGRAETENGLLEAFGKIAMNLDRTR